MSVEKEGPREDDAPLRACAALPSACRKTRVEAVASRRGRVTRVTARGGSRKSTRSRRRAERASARRSARAERAQWTARAGRLGVVAAPVPVVPQLHPAVLQHRVRDVRRKDGVIAPDAAALALEALL